MDDFGSGSNHFLSPNTCVLLRNLVFAACIPRGDRGKEHKHGHTGIERGFRALALANTAADPMQAGRRKHDLPHLKMQLTAHVYIITHMVAYKK